MAEIGGGPRRRQRSRSRPPRPLDGEDDEEFAMPEEATRADTTPPVRVLRRAEGNRTADPGQVQWVDTPFPPRAQYFAEAVDALRLIQELMCISPMGMREAIRILNLVRPPQRDLYMDILHGALNRHEHFP